MYCPFCAHENDEQLLVCRTCHRDITVPTSLITEHEELSLKRDLLRVELDKLKTRIGPGRRWFDLLVGDARENEGRGPTART